MTEFAKPRDVKSFAVALDKQYLWCRTYGHSFGPFSVTRGKSEGRVGVYYEQILRCKCKVKRYLLLTSSGSVVSSHYDYEDAPGYLTKGIGRVVGEGRDVLRKENITRLIEQVPRKKGKAV